MANRHSLSTKVLCLVAFPLTIQLGLFSWLAILERNAESELSTSTKARAISDAINVLSKDIFTGVATFSSESSLQEVVKNDTFMTLIDKIRSDYKSLKELTGANPELFDTVTKSEHGAEASLQTMRQLCINTQKYGTEAWPYNNPLWRQLHNQMLTVYYQQIVSMGKQQKQLANREPEIQAQLRKQILQLLAAGFGITITLGVLLAVYLTREITVKLEQLSDNAYRLASEMPLNPEMKGQDDISNLDRMFHSMARELKESIRKEKAIIDNAHDMICTLDAEGRFTSVNPATTDLFGYEPKQLLGQHLISIVGPTEVNKIREFLDNLKKETNLAPMELQITKADTGKADIMLSASWSPEEKRVFAVIHDMTERRRSEKLKEEVIAMVTHDLRTPLFTIQNILGFLAEDIEGKVEQRLVDYVAMADSNAERMLRLINDLIDSEKMQAKAMVPQLGKIDLNKSFQTCREIVSAIAEDVGVELIFAPTDLFANADEAMLERILFNLMANAIKFSPQGSTVSLSARKEESSNSPMLHIIVEDNGPGIAFDQQAEIFERFRQGTSRSSKLYASSGLGLSICKSFVDLQNGKIWVESELGKGSQFHFKIPAYD